MKLYAGVDLGTGVRGINSPDPVNAQDAATKNYVDTHAAYAAPAGGSYWELPVVATPASNSYTGAWATGPGLPPTTAITKLYATTTLRVKIFNLSAWATGAGGRVFYGCAFNGSSHIGTITWSYFNRLGIRQGAPYGVGDFTPAGFPEVNTTGTMNVVFYVQTDSGLTWNTDTADCPTNGATAVISEVP